MIPIVLKITNWFSHNFKLVTLSIISLLTVAIFILNNQLNKKDIEINRLYNNVQAYEQIASGKEDNNRVFEQGRDKDCRIDN